MNEKECLYRIMGMLEGCEELGGLSSRLVDKIKEMISVVIKEYQPVVYKTSEPVRATVTTNTGQQVVVKHPEIVDYHNTKYWSTTK